MKTYQEVRIFKKLLFSLGDSEISSKYDFTVQTSKRIGCMRIIITPKMISFFEIIFKDMIHSISSISEFYFMLVYERYIDGCYYRDAKV